MRWLELKRTYEGGSNLRVTASLGNGAHTGHRGSSETEEGGINERDPTLMHDASPDTSVNVSPAPQSDLQCPSKLGFALTLEFCTHLSYLEVITYCLSPRKAK